MFKTKKQQQAYFARLAVSYQKMADEYQKMADDLAPKQCTYYLAVTKDISDPNRTWSSAEVEDLFAECIGDNAVVSLLDYQRI